MAADTTGDEQEGFIPIQISSSQEQEPPTQFHLQGRTSIFFASAVLSCLALLILCRHDATVVELKTDVDDDITPMFSAAVATGVDLFSLKCSVKELNTLVYERCDLFVESHPNEPNIMITGGAGFVGSHLIDALRREGHKNIKVIDNLWRGKLSHLCEIGEETGYPCGCSIDLSRDFCFADLADSSQIGSLFEN